MILCHVVGLDNATKDNFIIDVLDIASNNNIDDILVLDLDDITNKIITHNKDFESTYSNFLTLKQDIYFNSVQTIWKSHFFKYLRNLLLDNKNKHIILIGLNTFFLNFHNQVLIDPSLQDKFLITTHIDNYVRDLADDYYLSNNYQLDANLDYHKFIKLQKDKCRDQYLVMEYKIKLYDDVINFIKFKVTSLSNNSLDNMIDNLIHTNNNTNNNSVNLANNSVNTNNKVNLVNNSVYYASFKRYENTIPMLNNIKTLVAYKYRWLALISLFSNQQFRRGIINKDNQQIPYIKELGPLNLNLLNKCCYLYELYPVKQVDDHRYLVNNTNFIRRYYVSNIKSELLLDKVIFEKCDLNK